MDPVERKTIDRRLARIEGQVRGIRRMVEEGAYCVDILNQISAIDSAIAQVSGLIASQHIRHCLIGHGTGEAHASANARSRDDVEEELQEILSRLVR